MRRIGFYLIGLFLTACGSSGGGANARFEGTYQMTAQVGGQVVAVCLLTASQTGLAVSGRFTCSDGTGGTFAANVNGRQFVGVVSGPRLACNISGTYDDDSFSGAASCAGGPGAFSGTRV